MPESPKPPLPWRAWAALLRVHAAVVPLLDRELQAATSLPLTWYDVLLELNGSPNRRLRMGELGERVVLSRTRVSRLVEEMINAGLVSRAPDRTDQRSSFAVLTDNGRRRLRQAAPIYLAGIESHFTSQLTGDELATLVRALHRVLEHLPSDHISR